MNHGPRRVRFPGIEPGSTPRTQMLDSAGSVSSLRCSSGLFDVRVSAGKACGEGERMRAD